MPRRFTSEAGSHLRDAESAVRRDHDLAGRVAKSWLHAESQPDCELPAPVGVHDHRDPDALPKGDPSRPARLTPRLLPIRLLLLAFFLVAVGLQVRAARVEAVKVR